MKNVIIILLLGMNVAMGIVLISTNNKVKNANLLLARQDEKIVILDHTIDKCYMSFVKINSQSIKSFFAVAGISELNYLDTQKLVVLIPPYPCDVCMEHEIENLRNRINSNGGAIYDLFVTNGSYPKYSKFYLEN